MIHGVGTNDADYQVEIKVTTDYFYSSGERKRKRVWQCPYYRKWFDMLSRCYSKKFHLRHPTYIDCTVCDAWLLFSNFRKWMINEGWLAVQGGENMHLDKDLLFYGNKVYSPETCALIPYTINLFIGEGGSIHRDYLIGCSWRQQNRKFVSQCRNPFDKEGDKRKTYLGLYSSEIEAHLVWKKRKHEYSCELAVSDYVVDERVKQVLLTRYKNTTIIEDHFKVKEIN